MKRTFAVLSLVFVIAAAANSQNINQQSEKLGKKQLASLVANAKTSAEHSRLATYYAAQARNDTDEALFHEEMAGKFHDNAVASSAKFVTGTVNHCLYIHDRLKKEAAKMRVLAQQQEQMANSGQ